MNSDQEEANIRSWYARCWCGATSTDICSYRKQMR